MSDYELSPDRKQQNIKSIFRRLVQNPVQIRKIPLIRRQKIIVEERFFSCGISHLDIPLRIQRHELARCAKVGVAVRCFPLPEQVSQARLMEQIQQINQDSSIHGCLLLRPLPAGLDEETVRNMLDPAKDVDGITDASLAGLVSGSGRGFAPCTAQACLEILQHYAIPLEGKRAVVVGRSLVVGRPAALLLDRANATVTVCHSRTQDLAAVCRQGDILVAALGRAQALRSECFRAGQVVVDVGIHVGADGKLCGDICQEDALQADLAFTPVPGGVY